MIQTSHAPFLDGGAIWHPASNSVNPRIPIRLRLTQLNRSSLNQCITTCSLSSASANGAGGGGGNDPILKKSSSIANNRSINNVDTKQISNTSVYSNTAVATSVFPYPAYARGVIQSQTSLAISTVEEYPPQNVGYDVERMQEWIHIIKGMFKSMSLGEISASAYDTAWVAMVPALNNPKTPQFPKCLHWIMKNQISDGSWGEEGLFLAYDRVCSTLACVVALKTWNMGHENIQKGLQFIRGNIAAVEADRDAYMPIGFEVVFPTLLDDANDLGLDLPYDSATFVRIRTERERKLKMIPMDVLHSCPTTLLHSLEGLYKIVDWKKLLKLQAKNGSFLFSPASTACALKYTGDKKCLQYLDSTLKRFNTGAVPNVYPVDLFEHLWVVDRLERLGIARYFKEEIKECLDYVYSYWTKNGIAWASESDVFDADDTAMGFRMLRFHGYDVSPDVFKRFEKGGQFFCFEGQTSQAITGMYNLYRASYVMLPGEQILERLRGFTRSFLEAKRDANQLNDKWIISTGLQGEVEYALNYPWYASLPRIETRQYIDQYGVEDVWIGKSLYKMPYVNNETFLNLAKADYNLCQAMHRKELIGLQRWYKESRLDTLTFCRHKMVECYFAGAATMFEPEMRFARSVWARCSVLTTVIDDFFDIEKSLKDLTDFLDAVKRWDPTLTRHFSQSSKTLFMALYNTVNTMNQEAFVAQGRNIISHLRQFWTRWITSIWIEAAWRVTRYTPSSNEYMEVAIPSIALEPIVQSTLFFVGERLYDDVIMHEDYSRIMHFVNVIGRLRNDIQGYKRETSQGKVSSINLYLKEHPKATTEVAIQHFQSVIDQTMVLLVQEYLDERKIPMPCKQIHINMARIMNFFYHKTDGFSSLTEMKKHVKSTIYNPMS